MLILMGHILVHQRGSLLLEVIFKQLATHLIPFIRSLRTTNAGIVEKFIRLAAKSTDTQKVPLQLSET